MEHKSGLAPKQSSHLATYLGHKETYCFPNLNLLVSSVMAREAPPRGTALGKERKERERERERERGEREQKRDLRLKIR